MTDSSDQTRPSTLARQDFLERYAGVYEHSPWIAEQVFEAGLGPAHDTAEGLQAAMAAIVEAAGRDAQLALLRAHPDLAGKLAVAGELTAESTAEQAGAGLDQCTPEELSRFQELNEAYQARFGFPFILAVAGRGRAEILAAFEARIGNDPETEFREALDQVHRIALIRLRQIGP
ncbi:MAG: 2-oxo-4-hydroxy-4-carboxy-5-ureidoimidazoline decarboxylase [Pseudomonadota bacterium]